MIETRADNCGRKLGPQINDQNELRFILNSKYGRGPEVVPFTNINAKDEPQFKDQWINRYEPVDTLYCVHYHKGQRCFVRSFKM